MFKVNDYDLGVVYQTDEHAIIRDAEYGHREWVAKIIAFYVVGPMDGSYHFFLKGKFYAAKMVRGVVETDPWSMQPIMTPKDYRRLCVYPVHLLERIVMVFPVDASKTSCFNH